MKMLHIADDKTNKMIWITVFKDALKEFGELKVIENGRGMSDEEKCRLIRECDVLLTSWGTSSVPASVARDMGQLKYICHVTGTLRDLIPLEVLKTGIPITNWGDAPAHGVAEGAMALLLAALKDLHHHIQIKRDGKWGVDRDFHGGSLEGLNVGVYGFGVIGRKFVEMLRPFSSVIRVFDPFVKEVPDYCIRVNSLDELFSQSQAVVIHAGLNEQTKNSVNAQLLAKLPRHGIVINTARGGIIDQAALFAELESGRLRAGLDVLEPDGLPEGHPARKWENLILTAHQVEALWPNDGVEPKTFMKIHKICLENLRSYAASKPLKYVMNIERYLLST